jgi:glyoxylase I family protein
MALKLNTVHHLTLTVTDVASSKEFYMSLLGFNFLMDWGNRVLLTNGDFMLGLTPPPDPAQTLPNDRFSENRVGLDHISFLVSSHADLEAAVKEFDARGISHGEIRDMGDFGIYLLAFRDPDNIQLELTAPKG